MRIIAVIFILFTFRFPLIACVCAMSSESFEQRIDRYDFIAHVKIQSVRVYSMLEKSRNESDFAKITILSLFKGPRIDSLYIWGIGTSCDMGMNAGQEWLIYANKKDNYYNTHSCTHSSQLTKEQSDWQSDHAFFLGELYQLKQYFNHSIPNLEDGNHESFFRNGKVKSRFTVLNGKLNGEFYYRTDYGRIHSYRFGEGKRDGTSFNIYAQNFVITHYCEGRLTELSEYLTTDSTVLDEHELYKRVKDSSTPFPKQAVFRQHFFSDGSILITSWYKNGRVSSIAYRNGAGFEMFSTTYHENGNIKGNGVYDENSRGWTFTGYYEDGRIEKKIIRYPNNKQEATLFNPDGTIKSQK